MVTMSVINDTVPDPCANCADTLAIRQLRHQAKNALQRIIAQILEGPALCGSREGRRAADELARRIELSAAISDALFGFTKTPESLPERLRSLAESLIVFHTDSTQTIRVDVGVDASITTSVAREELILRIVHELVVNALKHGMYMRLVGGLSIRLDCQSYGHLTLSVTNDGWKMEQQTSPSEGLAIVEELVRAEGGHVRISTHPNTSFQIDLPSENARHIGADASVTAIACLSAAT